MPRPPRIDYPDALYHVTVRGNGRARIFFTDADRLRFLDQLKDNVVTASLLLYAFVLMDNHFHLLVRTPRANLSQFMQRLNTSYALVGCAAPDDSGRSRELSTNLAAG
jgi:putative transposase